ncbi:MAG: Glyoxalase/bleomycin resistance protein/dioxygenase [Holophagaceae bacterium]|nr:Glyoxalase/bleomycin resistance protein/dioxygenase [Holophagaceae bacterium]
MSQELSNVTIQPLHQGISVANMDESIAWYQKMFGYKLVSDMVIPHLARIAFLELGDWSIELFYYEGAAPLPEDRRTPNLDIRTHGTKHVAYLVQDLDTLMADLKSKEVDIAMDVFPMQGDKVAFIRDNTGNLIELIQKPIDAKH